jgi:hypothetical protein
MSWIDIECRQDPGGPRSFKIEVHARTRNGKFHAKNLKIHLRNLEEFVAEFDRFISDRNRGPRLEGSYNSFIAFLSAGNMVICLYRIGGGFKASKAFNFHHFGEFEISQEHLLQLLEDFRALLKAQHT